MLLIQFNFPCVTSAKRKVNSRQTEIALVRLITTYEVQIYEFVPEADLQCGIFLMRTYPLKILSTLAPV